MPLLEIENLSVSFATLRAVDGLDLSINEGEVLGIVGESGSGKSVTMLAVMGLIGFPGVVQADGIRFEGNELTRMNKSARRQLTGNDIAMIFQEPMTSLNPCFTVGYQISETLKVHEGGTRSTRRNRTLELLSQVGIPDPERRLNSFPHQLSGGMNQRVMIAMAIACRPKLLIADEPTTALDVTIQAQILQLLLGLQREYGMALVLITHDMGVVAETAQRVSVMYAGQLVEERCAQDLFTRPQHPYTHALLEALPERGRDRRRLPTIPGVVPGLYDRPSGCLFNPRCASAAADCSDRIPPLESIQGGRVRCLYPLREDSAGG